MLERALIAHGAPTLARLKTGNLFNLACPCAEHLTGEIAALSPIQERYQTLMSDKQYIQDMLKTNAERAHYLAQKTLRKVYKKLGLYQV